MIICGREVVEGRIGLLTGLAILSDFGGGWGRQDFSGLEGEVMIDVRVVRQCTCIDFLRRSVILLKN